MHAEVRSSYSNLNRHSLVSYTQTSICDYNPLSELHIELGIARSLLGVIMEANSPSWSLEYQNCLDGILGSPRQIHEDTSVLVICQLVTARASLLNAAPRTKIWLSLARIIKPTGRLAIPDRFLGIAKKIEYELNIDAIKTGSFMQALDLG